MNSWGSVLLMEIKIIDLPMITVIGVDGMGGSFQKSGGGGNFYPVTASNISDERPPNVMMVWLGRPLLE